MSTPTEVAPDPVRKRTRYRGDPGMWAWVLQRITG
ncbi:MAG: succinate dehydrogenase, cytochrome b556 subunit, partial [Gordonia sp. (in: high G+C Gram-positive bacteria)]